MLLVIKLRSSVLYRLPTYCSNAYTLLEVLVAMSILTIALIPLTKGLVVVPLMAETSHKWNASCLLELEANRVKLEGSEPVPIKILYTKQIKYQIQSTVSGTGIKLCKMEVYYNKKKLTELQFYFITDISNK